MNKKGFTLVELLVVIVIIGLISYIGFPSLMALINDNKTTEFEYYGDLMIDAAKLYMRKEATDIQESGRFSHGDPYDIDLELLIQDEYITKFSGTKKDIKCDESNSKVRVKYDSDTGTYTFEYKLLCEDSGKTYTKDYGDEKFKIQDKN